MKKAIILSLLVLLLAGAILFVPIPQASYDDGGTREYVALTYKIVAWKRLVSSEDGPYLYEQTRVYGPADRGKSIDVLWERESARFGSRSIAYDGVWLDKTALEPVDNPNSLFGDIRITEIYADCFFAAPVIPMPYTIKLNGILSPEWCIGDQVAVTCENAYLDADTYRIEVDFLTVTAGEFELDPDVCYKPVIYLYPEEQCTVSVQLSLNGALTCTYPEYRDGWIVTASPDGTLTDEEGQTYNYLYWEGDTDMEYDLSRGFCVRGEDTAAFLEDALAKLGLNRREANEFIVYWLPLMQENAYNVITFQRDAYTDAAGLYVIPAPDTLIRVFMAWRGVDEAIELEPQELTAPPRVGFTVVEWGGTEVR